MDFFSGDTFHALRLDIDEWVESRNWWTRLPLLIWMVYILYNHLDDPFYTSLFGGLNLGIHELGHIMFGFMPEFIMIAAGSFVQCLVPVIAMGMFLYQRDYFAIAFSFGWLSTNLFSVATYAGDARKQELPLVSPFGTEDITHDWNYLLTKTGLLQLDVTLAFVLRCFAVASMLVCLIGGGWILWKMYRSSC